MLLAETLSALNLRPGMTVVDCTLGRGGHSIAIAQVIGSTGTLIGLDADPRNLQFAAERLKVSQSEVRLFHANFAELDEVLRTATIERVDAILADLGLSTNQLFDERYGLSFGAPMPLDMRIDPRDRQSAADYLRNVRETDLANVLYNLADERYSRRIARKIVDTRRVSPITTTDQLAELVRSVIPRKPGPPERIDPATRTFMAIRMVVNREVENLQRLLEQAPSKLKPGGVLAVITFHSVEDRIVKNAFRLIDQTGTVRQLTKKPIVPGEDETRRNPRSRSAKLRAIERTQQ